LSSLLLLDPAPAEIVIVDGDAKRSARPVVSEIATDLSPPIRWVPSEPGLTRQRNAGLGTASSDVVVFIDDDAYLAADALGALASVYRDCTVVGATGNVIEPSSNRLGGQLSRLRAFLPGGGQQGAFTRFGYPHRLRDRRTARDVQVMPGCFMSARLDDALAVRFDEALPGYGLAEDEDFSCRLAKRGRIRYEPRAVAVHDNAGFSSRDRRAFGRAVVTHRAYLFRKNFPQTIHARAQFRMLLGTLVVHRLLNGDTAGARGIFEGIDALRRGGSFGTGSAAAVTVMFISSHSSDGGSERYFEELLGRLPAGYVDAVVTLAHGPLVQRLARRGVGAMVVPTGPSWTELLASAQRVRRLVRGGRCRLVHANGVKAALVAVVATRGLGVPVVWVKHDHSFDGWIARRVARRCGLVVGVSRSVLRSVRGFAPTEVVPPGLQVATVDARVGRDRLTQLLGPGPVVLLVGRLDRAKGHDHAIEAIARVRESVPNAQLAFVGSAEGQQPGYRGCLDRLARKRGVQSAVSNLGHRDDVHELIAGADAVVVASRAVDRRGMGREGFGLVAAEALALGTPVVGYADGGLPEVVGRCAILVPPGAVEGLADALIRVLVDAELQQRLACCGRRRASDFDSDAWVSAMAHAYQRYASPARSDT
jgi:glycosyltransferase involved in cell wall biosynthesis/GT2 family glycosyltransferase